VRRRNQFCPQVLRDRGIGHARLDKGGKAFLIQLLQLAAAAAAEVAAGRLYTVGAWFDPAVLVQQVAGRGAPGEAARFGSAIALGGDADNFFRLAHRQAR